VLAAVVVVLLVAMGLDTKVLSSSSTAAAPQKSFDPAAWGTETFPKVQKQIEKKAVPAATLARAVKKDPTAAGKKYGVASGTGAGPVVSIAFNGTVGTGSKGIYEVSVPGVPKGILIRIQTGPAITGTDLRDAPGTISFGDFRNQIEYQNAGAELNRQLKKQVLSSIDTDSLTGKKVHVVGAFQLINPDAWLITPVKLEVK
jgi:predicted lipoprotein